MFIEASIDDIWFDGDANGGDRYLRTLGNIRATLIPAVTVPVSIVAAFIVMYALVFDQPSCSACMVLAIGLVVDDAMVVLRTSTDA